MRRLILTLALLSASIFIPFYLDFLTHHALTGRGLAAGAINAVVIACWHVRRTARPAKADPKDERLRRHVEQLRVIDAWRKMHTDQSGAADWRSIVLLLVSIGLILAAVYLARGAA